MRILDILQKDFSNLRICGLRDHSFSHSWSRLVYSTRPPGGSTLATSMSAFHGFCTVRNCRAALLLKTKAHCRSLLGHWGCGLGMRSFLLFLPSFFPSFLHFSPPEPGVRSYIYIFILENQRYWFTWRMFIPISDCIDARLWVSCCCSQCRDKGTKRRPLKYAQLNSPQLIVRQHIVVVMCGCLSLSDAEGYSICLPRSVTTQTQAHTHTKMSWCTLRHMGILSTVLTHTSCH